MQLSWRWRPEGGWATIPDQGLHNLRNTVPFRFRGEPGNNRAGNRGADNGNNNKCQDSVSGKQGKKSCLRPMLNIFKEPDKKYCGKTGGRADQNSQDQQQQAFRRSKPVKQGGNQSAFFSSH